MIGNDTDIFSVELENVSVEFETEGGVIKAVEDFSLAIAPREFVCIIGPSGCGKTTVLNVMAGFLDPTRGSLKFGSRSLQQVKRENKGFCGFVFQQAVLLPWRTAIENLSLPLEVLKKRGFSDSQADPESLLELVGLAKFKDTYPYQLSGGMQQRICIARALVSDPSLLLMDEPFGALDEISRTRMNMELLRIWRQAGKTIVFVTHSIQEAVFLADRVVIMTPHPGTLRAVVEVSIPRPRTLACMKQETFTQISDSVREMLHGNERGDEF